MARLNEPPVTGESLESLKRRFIRQNREITRANSTQSIRIRNLEFETSRLLSENLTLREQNIQLQKQLESIGNRHISADKLNQIKSQLEIKLAELGGLVNDLGIVHKKARQSSAFQENGRPEGQTPKRSPDQRNWKNAFTLSDVTGQQDGRLPPILEDKLYPRRTLESADIAIICTDAGNLTDSPDLGPPPVAHFEDRETIEFDAREKGTEEVSGLGLSSIVKLNNLETRKKRRESSYTSSSLSDSVDAPKTTSATLTTLMQAQSLKSGAKRKFSATDGEESRDPILMKDDFQFSRRVETAANMLDALDLSETAGILPVSPAKLSGGQSSSPSTKPAYENSLATTSRKALGEKSVNNSPIKSKRPTVDTISEPQKDASKKPRDRESDRSRPKPPASKPHRPSKLDSAVRPKPLTVDSTPPIPDLELDPEPQPEAEAISIPLSPPTFAPSTTSIPLPPPSTPPQADLAAARPSRRQRGSVSYAEPNLRDKMRRPTKDLVDAVGGDDKSHFQRSASARAESEGRRESDTMTVTGERKIEKPRIIRVKAEKVEEDIWKDLPLSSVTKYGEINVSEELPDSIETGPKGISDPAVAAEGGDEEFSIAKKASGSSAAIAALAGSSRAKSTRAKEVVAAPKGFDAAQDPGSEAFDAESTNPPTSNSAASSKHSRTNSSATTSTAPRSSLLTVNRTSRRYSSVPEAMGKDIAQRMTAPPAQDAISRTGSTRRRDTASVARRNVVENVGEIEIRGGGAVAGLRDGKGDRGDRERERAERVAGRRKSMMI